MVNVLNVLFHLTHLLSLTVFVELMVVPYALTNVLNVQIMLKFVYPVPEIIEMMIYLLAPVMLVFLMMELMQIASVKNLIKSFF
jgi:hypothetical protein